jgi:hypothetical protein
MRGSCLPFAGGLKLIVMFFPVVFLNILNETV